METIPYKKIVVIGTTGSGKSTLAEGIGKLSSTFQGVNSLFLNWEKVLVVLHRVCVRINRKLNENGAGSASSIFVTRY